MKPFLTTLFVAFFFINASAQIENRATLNYLFYNRASSNDLHHLDQSNVDLNYFLKSKKILKKIRWDNSFAYKTTFLDGSLQPNLQDYAYNSNFVYTKNLKNFLLFNARVNVRTELQNDISGRHIFPAFSFGYMRQSQTNKSIRYGFGVNYNNDFNKNTLIPFALFNYETAKIRFNATLPNSILFLVKQKPSFFYGVNATLTAGIFGLQNESASYLKMINGNVFGFVQAKLHNKLWIEAKPGVTLYRTVTPLDYDFKALTPISDAKLTNNFVLNIGLMYRM